MEQIAVEMNKIVIGDREYDVVGTPEKLPMSIFRPARMLAKHLDGIGGDQEKLKFFYLNNIDALLDVLDDAIRFALGEEQFAAVREEIAAMPVLEYCVFGVRVLEKLQHPGA